MTLPTTNRQWTSAQDGIDNLKEVEGAMPLPGENEVLVQINCIALNYRDTEVVMGLYNRKHTFESSSYNLTLALLQITKQQAVLPQQ